MDGMIDNGQWTMDDGWGVESNDGFIVWRWIMRMIEQRMNSWNGGWHHGAKNSWMDGKMMDGMVQW